jgi:hypothetical protein
MYLFLSLSLSLSPKVGTQVLLDEFEKLILKDQSKKTHDTILDGLKIAIRNTANTRHVWDEKALDSLVISI